MESVQTVQIVNGCFIVTLHDVPSDCLDQRIEEVCRERRWFRVSVFLEELAGKSLKKYIPSFVRQNKVLVWVDFDYPDGAEFCAPEDVEHVVERMRRQVGTGLLMRDWYACIRVVQGMVSFSLPSWRKRRKRLMSRYKGSQIETDLFSSGDMPYSNKSVLFGGTDEHVTMGNILVFERNNSFSFSFWFKEDLGNLGDVLAQYQKEAGILRDGKEQESPEDEGPPEDESPAEFPKVSMVRQGNVDGTLCRRCRKFVPYAVPDGHDGKLLCWDCQTWG